MDIKINLKLINSFIPYQFYKNGFKKCSFWYTSRQTTKKIYRNLMKEEVIGVPLLVFWFGFSSFDQDLAPFYQDLSLFANDQCKDDSFFGRC